MRRIITIFLYSLGNFLGHLIIMMDLDCMIAVMFGKARSDGKEVEGK